MTAGRSAPRYQMMALLYPQSKNLQSNLTEYFIVVVRLCYQLLKFTQMSTLGQYTSSLSDSDTRKYQSELELWANATKEEVSLLMAKTIKEESQENSKFRTLSSKFSESVSLRQKLKTNLRVLDSCSMYDHETTWKQTRKIGNATLFHQIAAYQDWKGQETSCTLMYTGKLGSGKSVLLANLIDDLNIDSQSKNVTVTYFFCRHDIPGSLKARTVIGSLARQLLRPMTDLAIGTRFIDETTTLAMDFEKIFGLLRCALPPKFKAYFVLDGLDECDSAEREILIPQLQKLQQIFSLLLCVSIRLDPDNVLKLSPERFTAARVTIPDDNPDIKAFISAELESRIESKKLVIGNPALILEIQDALLEGSQGMFLWVALQIESLCNMKTDDAIRQALADLPQDLPGTFFRILRKSEGSGKPYQRRILELVTVAHRPLTAEELRDALSVVPGDAVWNPSRLLNDINLILTCCGSLLTLDEEERTIRLVHHSVKQFLLSGFKDSANIAITIDSANRTMADIIVTYLNYGVFETQLSTIVVPQIVAASAPSQIIRLALDSSSVQSLALKFLKSRKQPDFDIGKTLTETSKLFGPHSVDEFYFYSYAKLYWLQHILYTSEQGPVIYDLLLKLFKSNAVNTNAIDKDGRTPLSLAARNGHETVVKLLLDSDIVDADSKDGEGLTPLLYAARLGHEAVVKLLLEKGAELETKNTYGLTPLSCAAGNGHEAVVKLLLEKGAELETKDEDGLTPLLYAAANGHEAVVKLLLEKGAELEAKDEDGLTPLLYAAANGHEAVVKLLLEKGAELETKNGKGQTPLSYAAGYGHEAVVKLLLEQRAKKPQ
jgi:ankyrin repeat protein